MYIAKLAFAQAMGFLPQHTFHRYVQRYDGNRQIKSFTCQDQFWSMAFAQLNYPSLRDIEACLSAPSNKLYHMGNGPERKKLASRTQRETRLAYLNQ